MPTLAQALEMERDRRNCVCELELDPSCPATIFHAFWEERESPAESGRIIRAERGETAQAGVNSLHSSARRRGLG